MTSADGSEVDPIQGYEKGDPPLWLIIAIAVGCLALILLIICLIVCCVKRRRRIDQDEKIDDLREELGLGKSPRTTGHRTNSSPIGNQVNLNRTASSPNTRPPEKDDQFEF